jgi:hypothetical protein
MTPTLPTPRARPTCPSCGRKDALAPAVVEELVREGDDVALIRVPTGVCISCQRRLVAPETVDVVLDLNRRLHAGERQGWERVGSVYRIALTLVDSPSPEPPPEPPEQPPEQAQAPQAQRPPPPSPLPAYRRMAISRSVFLSLAHTGVIPRVWRQIRQTHGRHVTGWAYPAPAIEALSPIIDRFTDLIGVGGDDAYIDWWEATAYDRASPSYVEPLAYYGDLDIIDDLLERGEVGEVRALHYSKLRALVELRIALDTLCPDAGMRWRAWVRALKGVLDTAPYAGNWGWSRGELHARRARLASAALREALREAAAAQAGADAVITSTPAPMIARDPEHASGRRFAMTPEKVRRAMRATARREMTIADLCRELGVSRKTLYRHVAPGGSPRPPGRRILGETSL